jgi:hypothetical protein
VSYGTGDNKSKEALAFEVASFDIRYNCILGRPFLLKFMTVMHTAYATLKMHGLKGMITITDDQCDALACENTTLMHDERFSKKSSPGIGGQDSKDARWWHIDQIAGAQAIDDRLPSTAVSQEGHIWRLSVKLAAHQSVGGSEGG